MVTDDTSSIATRVRMMRTQRGWSLKQLGDRAGIDPSTIWKIEAGATPNPGNATLGKISQALGVSLSEITGERSMPRRRTEIIEGVARVPVMRVRVQASGDPAWDDTRDTMIVSASLAAGRPNLRAAVVSGECMTPYVNAGERVVFDPDALPQDRDMVVVTTDHGDILIKWYRLDDDGAPYLRAADDTEIRPNGARLEGVVLTVERNALRDPK